ncbi:MAG: arginase [Crocinitomicaceae bacterium]|nr:arginase [Crocinitomicaceae bacterium]
MKRDIQLLINKSEITAGTRGSSLGPEAIMTAARKNGDQFFGRFPMIHIQDVNHLLDAPIKFPFAKRIEGLVQVFENVSNEIKKSLESQKFPLVIASDHGSAGGTIAGIKAANPGKRLGVIWIDAHGDLHTPYTTPSGNMHGMPLATALSENNEPCRINNPSQEVVSMWDSLKNMGVPERKVNPEDLVFIAVRDTEAQEDAIIERLDLTNHTVGEIRKEGKEAILRRCLDQLKDCDIIYVSFDVDSMDPEHTSHGTGTPVDNGLMPKEAEFFLCELAKQEKLVCMEFVEVNPCLDEKTNKMAEVAFDLLKAVGNTL